MDFAQLQPYILPFVLAGFFGWRFVRFRRVKRQLPGLIKGGAVVVDVRSRGEFASGSRAGSINIPLNELDSGLETLDRSKPVVLCCASGTRSAMAATVLRRKGFVKVVNAGAWTNTV